MLYYQVDLSKIYNALKTAEAGLSSSEAAKRLERYGPNRIVIAGTPLWRKIIEPFWSVFVLVLVVAAVVSLLNHEPLDAVIIGGTVLASAVVYYAQAFSTERVLRALRRYNALSVEAWRDGRSRMVPVEDLVPGDVVIVHEGEKLPADLRIMQSDGLRVDESMLTGESNPANKQAGALRGQKEAYEQSNMLFGGSFVLAGEGRAMVVATGNSTEFGRIAGLAQGDALTSPVQLKIDRLVTQIIGATAAVSVIVFALSLVRGIAAGEALRFALSLAVSAVPEGLPVAITVVLVLGMQRMARRKALVRSMRAIEDVGLVTTVATDKTGTLTKNQLRVQDEWQPSSVEKSTYFGELVALSANAGGGEIHDPLDATMVAHSQPGANPGARKLVRQLPFELSLALSGNVWRDGQEYLVAVKGSPEAVLALCRLGGQAEEQAMGMVGQLASHGYRVVALAETRTAHQVAGLGTLPRTGWHFGGLLALADELRPEAEDAVRRAHEAGIKVVMITGDHADTAYAIGKTLGLVDSRDQVVDSRQFSDKSDDELHDIIRGVRVFARVVPESKYRILELLKRDEITAMTGDGVNDVPALTKADVGVAMGSGSQLAREAGDIILLDDNFSSLVRGIGEGRAIVSNIRKMLVYLLATNAGEVLTMMGALVVGLPLPVVAVQVLWINLVTDTTMVIPLGVEPAERDTMRKPPRPADAPILDGYMVGRIAVIATVMATLTLVIFGYFLQRNGLDYARTVAFYVLAVAQWASALSARSETRSALSMIGVRSLAFWGGLVLAVGLQVLAMVGPLAAALHTVSVRPDDLAIVSLLGIAVPIITADVLKVLLRSRAR